MPKETETAAAHVVARSFRYHTSGAQTMSNLRRYAPLALICLLAGAMLYVGWQILDHRDHAACSVCGREVHLASRVDGEADGEALTFCCAACALRAENQEERPIRLTQVFDYRSGEPMAPQDAVAVVGSNVNLCMREHALTDARKETHDLHFDRCSPGVLAFKSEVAAEQFRAEHGGVRKSFAELEESFR